MSLIISRRPGERLIIGDVVIRIGKRKGRGIQLLIDAPPDIQVDKPSNEEDRDDRAAFEDHLAKTRYPWPKD